MKTSMKKTETALPEFSFFKGPITNIIPAANANVKQIHHALTSTYYQAKTEELRRAKNNDQIRKAKKKLDYVTFGGTFRIRAKEELVTPSRYCCIDFDHVRPNHFSEIKISLLNDPLIETALMFTSPSGTGLKWVVEIDLDTYPDYEIYFNGIVAYLRQTYPDYFNSGCNIIDTTGKDICRACFLCYDPEAYINPKYLAQ